MKISESIKRKTIHSVLKMVCLIIVLLLSLAGIWQMSIEFKQKEHSKETQLYYWIKERNDPRDRFLIPVHLETFRTDTKKPIYVDFFAIPYNSPDVVQWYHRVLAANKFYDTGSCEELFNIQYDSKLTHIITEKENLQPNCQTLTLVYEDQEYVVYQFNHLE
jgi:hypothetical protein